jgi:hypothetical protein
VGAQARCGTGLTSLARAALLAFVFIDALPHDPWASEPKNIQAAVAEYFGGRLNNNSRQDTKKSPKPIAHEAAEHAARCGSPRLGWIVLLQ